MFLSLRLQGGYTLESLSNCALAVGRMLLGEAPPELPPLVASEVESETVWLVAKEQSKYWKNINIKACQPKEGFYSFVCQYFLMKLTSISQTLKSSHSLFPVRYLRGLFIIAQLRASAELLKAHRQDYMYQKFDMLEVPLMHDDVREKFSAQIMCSWVYHSSGLSETNYISAEKTFWITKSWWFLPMNCNS
jgi:histone deacetylase 6